MHGNSHIAEDLWRESEIVTKCVIFVGFVGLVVSCCLSCSVNALGTVVRVYPVTVQGLAFYPSKI